jgi:hypothetical protein
MTLRLSEEEYAELMRRRGKEMPPLRPAGTSPPHGGEARGTAKGEGRARRNKYGNRKIEIDGMKFDSKHEADYYFNVLMGRWMAGELKLVARQVPFDLPGGIRYIADFLTVDAGGNVEVIDAKSEATKKNRVYINKKKQMRAVWGIEIREV